MTGYQSKKDMAQDKLTQPAQDKLVDDRRAYYEKFDDLYAVYLNGVYDGKKAAQPAQEWIKRINDAVEAEREECAKIAEEWDKVNKLSNYGAFIALQIRERGTT
jgi:hypothetical protein